VIDSSANATARNATITQSAAQAAAELYDPARVFGFLAALGLVLVRFGMLQELVTYVVRVNLLLQYVFGLPALMGLVLSGGLRRVFRAKTAYWWTAYAFWLFVAACFSSWRGGSLLLAWGNLRSTFLLFLVMAGLAVTWRECKWILRMIGCGTVLMLVISRLFADPRAVDRFSLAFGTVANANDVACVLLLLLPFLLWIGMSSKWTLVAVIPAVGYGVYVILTTGSRGALLGLLAEVAFFLLFGSLRQRIAVLTFGVILFGVTLATAPRAALRRMTTFSQEGGSEAVESLQARQALLWTGIEYTLRHPLFGVGPGEMADILGQQTRKSSGPGEWQDAHDIFLEASSECGIPALIFLLGGFVSTWRRLNATHRAARGRADCQDIRGAVFCVMTGMAGFTVAASFLNFAYLFYAPAMGALAIAISAAAGREFEIRGAAGQIPVIAAPAWRARRRLPGVEPRAS
jgi:hypothetical protein